MTNKRIEELKDRLKEAEKCTKKLVRLHEFMESQDFVEDLEEGLQKQKGEVLDLIEHQIQKIGKEFMVLLRERRSSDAADRLLYLIGEMRECLPAIKN